MPEQSRRPFSRPLTPEERALSDEAVRWFSRVRSPGLSERDRQEFEAWKRQSAAHEQAWTEVCALWNERELLAAAKLEQRRGPRFAQSEERCGWLPRPLAGAVLLVAIVLWGALSFIAADPLTWLRSDYRTTTGEQRTIRLEDRSVVMLNTETAIATDFKGDTRRVRLLKGEAFFQAQTDAGRPFLVDSRGIMARAVGTMFLVRERDEGVEVTVVEGTVEVSGPEWHEAPIPLAAGQRMRAEPDGPGAIQQVERDMATAWTRGRLVVESEPLSEVIDEVRRYHQGQVLLLGETASRIKVSGNYHLADTMGILTSLAQTLPIRMVRLTDRFVLLY